MAIPGSPRNDLISSFDGGGCMSDSPPAAYRSQRVVQQRREQTHSGSFLDCSGYEMDQASPSVERSRPGPSSGSNAGRMSSQLQPPPAAIEGSRHMYGKRPRSSEILEQRGIAEDIEIPEGHIRGALGVGDDWYRECNETVSLVITYGERGERWESPRAVAACRDRAPPKSGHESHGTTGSSGGLTDLLMLLREVHEEYCERISGGNEQGRARS